MEDNLTRLTLIQKLQSDCNESSWDEFISLYKGYVFVIIKKMNFNEADCHDIMQTTFLKVWKSVQNFEHGGHNGQFRRWLAMIARNTALNHIDKSKREANKQNSYKLDQQHDYLVAFTEPEIEKMADKEWGVYIANIAWSNVKADLNQTLQDVFQMSLDGRPRTEIAEVLDLPPNTVSVYKRRVTATLQKEIKRLEKTFG
jgi:RNA polymerase sigma factor (sigma-70 family)